MSTYFPEAVPVLGNLAVRWLTTATDLTALKLATEWNAASSVDLSCFLRPLVPSATQGTGQAPNRICTTITLPQAGRTEISAFDLRYVYDPQGDDADPDNKAKAALVANASGILVFRKGISFGTAGAVGHKYEAWRGRLGRQNNVTSGDDDFAEFEKSQMFFPTQDVVEGVMVA